MRIWWSIGGLVLVFLVYSHSFNRFPILERQHSVLAEADAAPFAILLEDFSPTRKFGNEYNTDHRSIRDIAQKHKTHHFLYALTGGLLFQILRDVYALVGADPHQALYAVNAMFACLNLVLLVVLLRRFSPAAARHPVRAAGFCGLFAVSLGTWIYYAIPESWPFSATLVLGFLVLWFTRRPPYLAMAAYIGVAMLNNLLLGSLGVFILLRRLQEVGRPWRALRDASLALGVMLVVWAAALTALSVFDDSLRPDHFIAYTLWFKKFTGAGLPLYDPYVWESALTNLFINPVTSHQPDPVVPQEALLTTIRHSPLGLAAVLAYLAVMAVALRNAWRRLREARGAAGGWLAAGLQDEGLHVVGYCVVFAVLVVIMFFGGGFLYSCVTVPLLVLVAARYVDLDRPVERWLFWGALAIIAVNNTLQILEFRDALRAML